MTYPARKHQREPLRYSMPISWDLFWHNEVGELVFPTSASGWTKAKEALCPFHADKNPGTFNVNILSGNYHCWSCGATGTAAHYVHEVHGLRWPDAYRYVQEHQ